MIKVLIVDDSKVIQEFLIHLFSSDPDLRVVGVAKTGHEAIKLTQELSPDVITMDLHMPEMDGYEATQKIMQLIPTPIVIVTGSIQATEVTQSFNLIEAGALAVALRPPDIGDPGFDLAMRELIQTVKLMSDVKVIKRFPNQSKIRIRTPRLKSGESSVHKDIRLIAIGASTGGPVILQKLLSNMPRDLQSPVLIVQHISKGFVQGFINWLLVTSTIPITLAKNGEFVRPGIAYVAPDDFQMGITKGLKISLSKNPPENGLCPSVDYLFRSVAENVGSQAIGILLTGMGKDGARELKAMKDKGAMTIAQDEQSCVVFGMPGEAVKLNAASSVLSPAEISEYLNGLSAKHNIKSSSHIDEQSD